MTIKQATDMIDNHFRLGHHEMEAGYPEPNTLNDDTRQFIQACHDEWRECWLGNINLHRCQCSHLWTYHSEPIQRQGQVIEFRACKACECRQFSEERPLWKWDGGLVLNFAARIIVPHYDAELESLILARACAEYTGVNADYERVNVISNHIDALGGYHLFWN